MFQKILQWVREMIKKMIGTSTIKQALSVDVAMSTAMATELQKWSAMYENKSDWLTTDIRGLGLPAAIAGEIARSVTIELKVAITGSSRADYLSQQFEKVVDALRDRIEQANAKGGMMFKPWVRGKDLFVDYVQADCFYPTAFDSSGNITGVVFADQRTIGSDFYTRLEYHNLADGIYSIRNMAYKSQTRDMLGQQVPLTVINDWAGLLPEAEIKNMDRPLFAYFKFPLANNVDPLSPLGVSCYARAVNLIKDADLQWDGLLWEFDSGKRALYVDTLAFGKDSEGNVKLPNKRLYKTLNGSTDIGKEEFFEEWTPDLREENILRGLDAILKRIEYTCGLAYGTLSDPQSIDKTATEIKTSKQRTYATITDTQKALQNAMEQLLWAMDTLATLYKLAPKGAYSTAYDFDDSVVVDKDMQFQQDLRLLDRVMSKVEFRVRNFGEDEATAKKAIAAMQAEQPPDLFGQGNAANQGT
jgi:A118 family predicted phage portal protein